MGHLLYVEQHLSISQDALGATSIPEDKPREEGADEPSAVAAHGVKQIGDGWYEYCSFGAGTIWKSWHRQAKE